MKKKLKKKLKKLKESQAWWENEVEESEKLLKDAQCELEKTEAEIGTIERKLGIKPRRNPSLPPLFSLIFPAAASGASEYIKALHEKNAKYEWPKELTEKEGEG